MRLFSFGGYGLALAALALVVFGAIVCPPSSSSSKVRIQSIQFFCHIFKMYWYFENTLKFLVKLNISEFPLGTSRMGSKLDAGQILYWVLLLLSLRLDSSQIWRNRHVSGTGGGNSESAFGRKAKEANFGRNAPLRGMFTLRLKKFPPPFLFDAESTLIWADFLQNHESRDGFVY